MSRALSWQSQSGRRRESWQAHTTAQDRAGVSACVLGVGTSMPQVHSLDQKSPSSFVLAPLTTTTNYYYFFFYYFTFSEHTSVEQLGDRSFFVREPYSPRKLPYSPRKLPSSSSFHQGLTCQHSPSVASFSPIEFVMVFMGFGIPSLAIITIITVLISSPPTSSQSLASSSPSSSSPSSSVAFLWARAPGFSGGQRQCRQAMPSPPRAPVPP